MVRKKIPGTFTPAPSQEFLFLEKKFRNNIPWYHREYDSLLGIIFLRDPGNFIPENIPPRIFCAK